MKKHELVKLLEGVPDDAEIIMAKDSEGNEFSPMASYTFPAKYVPETTYYGEIYSHTADDPKMSNDGEPIPEEAVPCIVLWPTN